MIWRAAKRGGACLVLLIPAYFIAAVVGALVPGARADIASGDGVEILLAAGPIHYDIVIPATDETRAAFGFAQSAGVPVDAAEWIIVGWGARDFYTTTGSYADLEFGAVFRAVTGDRSVLHIDAIGPVPTDHGLAGLTLSAAQFSALVAYVKAELTAPTPIAETGYSDTDAFFPARSRFSLFRPCNQWISEALRTAGVRMGVWTPTPYAVRISLARANG